MFRTSLDIQNGGSIDERLEMFKFHKLYQFYPIWIGVCVCVGGGGGGGVTLSELFCFICLPSKRVLFYKERICRKSNRKSQKVVFHVKNGEKLTKYIPFS